MAARGGDQPTRLWPAFTIIAVTLPTVLVVQVVATLAWAAIAGATGQSTEWDALIRSPGYFLFVTAVAQGTFALLALAGASLARSRPRPALGLSRGRARGLEVPAMLGTLFISVVSGLWWELRYDEPSDSLVAIGELFTESPTGMFVAIFVSFSVLPGLCEELLFRGFLQRHLLRRWSALPAVGLTSVLFAGIHLDPQHVWSVLPLALWLGYVGWRSDAVIPAILCHAFNNAFSMLMMRVAPSTAETTSWTWAIAMTAIGLPAFLWTVWQLERRARAYGPPAT